MARKEVAPILAKDFEIVKIDIDRTIGGKELLKKHRSGKGGGIPWFDIVDPDGKHLTNSNGPKGNIGCPWTDPEIDAFIVILKKVVSKITEDDLAVLKKSLVAQRERKR